MSDKGFNFRLTAGYTTDGTDETYVSSDIYPTTRNGATFGWISGGSDQKGDRFPDNVADRRLCGDNEIFTAANGPITFRVDLPAPGVYSIRLAVGYNAFANTYSSKVVIKDTTAPLLTTGPHLNTLKQYFDAADIEYTEAAWPASNSAANLTFVTTILNLELGDGTNKGSIAHLMLSQVARRIVGPFPTFRPDLLS